MACTAEELKEGSTTQMVDSPKASVPLVLINPVGNDARCWQFLDLKNAHAVEYPGHGANPRRPGWTYDEFADEVVTKFEGPIDLFGMSMGGATVARILLRHPKRVRSAVIACSGAFANAFSTPEAREAHRRVLLGRGQRALEGAGMRAIVDETITRWFTPLAVRERQAGVVYAEQTLLHMDPQAWNDIWIAGANSEPFSIEALKAITQPVTIIGGMHDAASGLKGLAELHKLVPKSRYEILAGPHMMHLEEPENLAAALGRHFAWAPIGNRVERPIGTFGWLDESIARKGAA
jgi:pimeloyl-ACP methyl ester carboxylesterase